MGLLGPACDAQVPNSDLRVGIATIVMIRCACERVKVVGAASVSIIHSSSAAFSCALSFSNRLGVRSVHRKSVLPRWSVTRKPKGVRQTGRSWSDRRVATSLLFNFHDIHFLCALSLTTTQGRRTSSLSVTKASLRKIPCVGPQTAPRLLVWCVVIPARGARSAW
jgi:hypothetical protein